MVEGSIIIAALLLFSHCSLAHPAPDVAGILHPAADNLLHPPDAVDADNLIYTLDAAATGTGTQLDRNCPNGWVDGTYVGMGNKHI